MNVAELKTLLETRKGASPITLTALTKPNWKPLKETGPNPFKNIVKKRTRLNGMINWIYETAVNRQRIREGAKPDFEAFPRKWGTRVHGTPWVTHKDKLYLELKCQNVYEVQYVDENDTIIDGVTPYVEPSHPNPRQELDDEIILRDFTVTNILNFTWNGNFYEMQRQAA